ncbi:hypothetical protein [Candidatus Nitrosotenuis cloacae]|uniref:hypothetical protein n=1 Tax=Candidatus Nitrosotenuis cloacae TaxID=1603555 RepID=UPI002281EC63|nr:hypothetical protein [Candidatus Nitrosotenuis cloacae]
MHTEGQSEPKKGSGYFAKRLKENGAVEPAKAEEKVEPKQEAAVEDAKAGQIFEESTKSIATMTDDVSETAKLVSSMRDGLERVNKIAGLFSNNPLCDSSGSCSYDGEEFSPDQNNDESSSIQDGEMTAWQTGDEQKIVDMIGNLSPEEMSNLKLDADTIRAELKQFRDQVSKKESEVLEFREKLNQAKMQAQEFVTRDFTDVPTGISEFDSIASSKIANFESIPDNSEFEKLSGIRQEIKNEEKKLLEVRWKLKKAEADYEGKKAAADEMGDLTAQVENLESKRDSLQAEIRKLEDQHKEPKLILKELEQKIESAKKEYEERQAAKQQLEDVRSVLEYLKLDKDGLKADLEQTRAKIKEVEKEYQEKKAANDALEDARFAVSSLKMEKSTLDGELEQIQYRIKKAEKELEEKIVEKEKIGEYKAVVMHLKLEKESLNDELVELKSRIKKTESEYQEKKAAVEELHEVREVLAYLKPERESLKSEISQIRSKIEKLEQSYDEIISKKREAQLEYDDLRFKLKRMESERGVKNEFSHIQS